MIVKTRSLSHTIPLNLSDYITYEGSKECSGYDGIKNLLNLLKADVKAICKEYGVYIPKQPVRLKELKSLMAPFNIHWDEWSNSSYCNLSSIEVRLINLYRNKPDLAWAGNELDLNYDLALTYLTKATRRLKSPEAAILFQKWRDFKHLDSQNPDEFLEVPLEGLHHIFPNRVYRLLQLFGNNMKEVLNKITIKELYKYRNFGIKAEKELRAILKNYQCSHLLK